MRKIVAYGAAALLALSAGATGVSFAQDTTTETETASVAIEKAWLGVSVSESDAGVVITRIATGSPAEAAGLEVDDVIVAAGDTAIATVDDLLAVVDAAAVGDVVSLTVTRADEALSVDVTLEARQRGMGGGRGGMFADPLHMAARALGVTVEEADGVYTVTAVDEDAPFALEVGDVITAVNGEALASLDWRTLVDPSAETTITLTVERDGEAVSVEGALAAFAGRQGMMPPGDGQPGQRNGGQTGAPPGGMNNGGQRGNPPNGRGDGQQPNDAPPADLPADAPAADGAV
jgi:S1-C subfamily serine protease